MPNYDGLDRLVEEGIIDAVHSRLMSGKEATVYIVERAGHLGAAKVYKTRDERTFKKTASYVEGRNQTRNSRDRRAMQKKSVYGRGLIEEGWQTMEFRALTAAFDAGVRVPEPYFLHDNVLFMELIVDKEGVPASRLVDFSFTPEEATGLHLEIFHQVRTLLGTGRIHGDLSAYNVLMAAKGPTIIDLPQVVDVAGNNNARSILRRDLRNVTEHLRRAPAAPRRLRRHAVPAPDARVAGSRRRSRSGRARLARRRRQWTPRPRRREGPRRPRQGPAPVCAGKQPPESAAPTCWRRAPRAPAPERPRPPAHERQRPAPRRSAQTPRPSLTLL